MNIKLKDAWIASAAAKECGITPSTLDSAIKAGYVPTYPNGNGRAHVLLKDVRAYLADESIKPGRKAV